MVSYRIVTLSILLATSRANVTTDHAARLRSGSLTVPIPVYDCPDASSSGSTQLPIVTRVRLTRAPSGTLCTLTRSDGSGPSIPVGRSYGSGNGNDWERVAGPFASIEYDCSDSSYCEVTIPNISATKQIFELNTFEHGISKRDEIARFLEQATFGTTHNDLKSIERELEESSGSDLNLIPIFSQWIYSQVNEVKPTSHRETWRHLTSPRIEGGREGRRRGPCEKGARWRRAAFHYSDAYTNLRIKKIDGVYHLSIDGIFRTRVKTISFQSGKKFKYRGPQEYSICFFNRKAYDRFGISYEGVCEETWMGNPSIDIDISSRPKYLIPFDIEEDSKFFIEEAKKNKVETVILKEELSHSMCRNISDNTNQNIYAELSNGQVLIFEPTLVWLSNIAEKPLNDGGGETVKQSNGVVQCPNVPRTFLNENNCKMSQRISSCAPTGSMNGDIVLNPRTLRSFYNLRNIPVYSIVNLRMEEDLMVDAPCEIGATSRWKKSEVSDCTDDIDPQTAHIFRTLIKESNDVNIHLKDVIVPEDSACHESDQGKFHMSLWANDECYTTVHPDEYNVYSFKDWAQDHPGNTLSFNPIYAPATNGEHVISFPTSHSPTRWNLNKERLEYVGRFGDSIPFNDLPLHLKSYDIAESLGVYASKPDGVGILVCGSPGEVANDGYSNSPFVISQLKLIRGLTQEKLAQQRKTVWAMVVTTAKDQLRQRVAWALSQLLVIRPASMEIENTEIYLSYYDIFVRHAFGNYRDILREVAYSPLMSHMLTYFESKSTEYIWKTYRRKQFADENFAREIMQLFSIGLIKMKTDGSPILDSHGNEIPTYSNDDITEYARAWTGFTQQQPRGNVEDRDTDKNGIDPMRISIRWRDHYPKQGLDRKYIGDAYPLCSDIPPTSFLKSGAKYRLLGKTKISDDQELFLLNHSSDIAVTILDDSSILRQRLCRSWNGECTYPGIVQINWDIECTGIECNLDNIKVVEVEENVYYEYIRPACIKFPFFQQGKLLSKKRREDGSICAERSTYVAASACCGAENVATHTKCKFTGERIPFPVAEKRCLENGEKLCDYNYVRWTEDICNNYDGYFWTAADCEITVVVAEDGRVAIASDVANDTIDHTSLTFFRVNWKENHPDARFSCGGGSCQAVGEYCHCSIELVEERVFTSQPSRSEVLSKLHIGGLSPRLLDYESEEVIDDVTTHVFNLEYKFSRNTVFQVKDEFGRELYLKNHMSDVQLSGTDFIFRNPPSFFDSVPDTLDALFETEATIDHYFYHLNTAPFLATRFIQRFGISNPSPGFIERVSTAFKSGNFQPPNSPGIPEFGDGSYGSMSAMIAAILMDNESRDVILDSDPIFGAIREPLVKLVSLLRNLDYQQTNGSYLEMNYLQTRIGQESYEHPSVFSFYLPDYSPPGLPTASLVSPEAMLLPQAPTLVNGMLSLIKFGLSRCHAGFGNEYCGIRRKPHTDGDYSASIGRLSYKPSFNDNAEDVIDYLSTVLTSGRMTSKTKEIIATAFSSVPEADAALRLAEQLTISSPEYHTTGKSKDVISTRPSLPPLRKTCKRHKAVVHVLLKGGCDSFNLLVPHSKCGGKNLYFEYKKARGSIAIAKKTLLKIDASTSTQQCKMFGLHPSLPVLQSLYNEGEALFLAGVGVLSKPVTKDNYLFETKTQLFAHNKLQEEIGRLDPYQKIQGTGTMGRLADALQSKKYNVEAFAIDTSLATLQGKDDFTAKSAVSSLYGFEKFDPSSTNSSLTNSIHTLNGESGTSNGFFSDIWSTSLHQNLKRNNDLHWAQQSASISWQDFPYTQVGLQLKRVAQMIEASGCRGSDRDVFYIETGMYDHHSDVVQGLQKEFSELNDALNSFVIELKSQGKWEDVTVMVTSDFGRTLSPNSGLGTDHGWSGHSFILGGDVKGGKILGEYPDQLVGSSDISVGRGRLIPTMPWEAPWNAVLGWMGIEDKHSLDEILPNRQSFAGMLLDWNDLFHDGEKKQKDCIDGGKYVSCNPDHKDYFNSTTPDSSNDSAKGSNEEISSNQDIGSRSGRGNIISSVVIVLVASIMIGVCVAYDVRTGYFSNIFSNIKNSIFARIEEKKKWDSVQRDDDENTVPNNRSFEVDTFHLLHYKGKEEVEVTTPDNAHSQLILAK